MHFECDQGRGGPSLNLMVDTIVLTVGALAAKSLVGIALERGEHLLVVTADVRVVRQLVFKKVLLIGSGTLIRCVRVLRVPRVISQAFCLHFAFDQLRVGRHVVHYLLA